MISHERFGQLRLRQFLPSAQLADLAHWEFLGRSWLGEALGFSEWLRLETEPDVLRSLAIDFSEFPINAAAEVLLAIDLPVRPGLHLAELRSILGEPVDEMRFVSDRVTYDFTVQDPDAYRVSCTVLDQGGLSYLVVTSPLGTPEAEQAP